MVVLGVGVACAGAPGPKPTAGTAVRKESAGAPGSVTNRFSISGMKCKDCAKGLAAELRLTPGVVRAVVSLADAEATVVSNTNRVATVGLLAAIREAGFQGRLLEPPTATGRGASKVPNAAPSIPKPTLPATR